MGVEDRAGRNGHRVGKPLNHPIGAFRIAADPQVDVEPVRLVPQLEQNIPQCQAVFPARDCHENAIVFSEHFFGLDRPRHLVMDKTREATFAEGRMVPGELDDRFGLAFCAVHGVDDTSSQRPIAISNLSRQALPETFTPLDLSHWCRNLSLSVLASRSWLWLMLPIGAALHAEDTEFECQPIGTVRQGLGLTPLELSRSLQPIRRGRWRSLFPNRRIG